MLDRGGGAIAPLSFLKTGILVLYSPYKIEKDTYFSYFAPFNFEKRKKNIVLVVVLIPPTHPQPLNFLIFF